MLDVGDEVPDFTLPAGWPDGRRDPVRLHDALAKGPVVLSFFPLAFTRVCTTQMCDLRDSGPALDGLGAQAFGFSCDAAPTNAAFAKAQGMTQPILSDPNREVVDRIWSTETVIGVHRVPKRGWMVIGQDARVVAQHVADRPGDAWPGNEGILAALARTEP